MLGNKAGSNFRKADSDRQSPSEPNKRFTPERSPEVEAKPLPGSDKAEETKEVPEMTPESLAEKLEREAQPEKDVSIVSQVEKTEELEVAKEEEIVSEPAPIEEKVEESKPEKLESKPEKVEESKPEKVEEQKPEKAEESKPEKIEETDKTEEVKVTKIEESLTEKVEVETEKAATHEELKKEIVAPEPQTRSVEDVILTGTEKIKEAATEIKETLSVEKEKLQEELKEEADDIKKTFEEVKEKADEMKSNVDDVVAATVEEAKSIVESSVSKAMEEMKSVFEKSDAKEKADKPKSEEPARDELPLENKPKDKDKDLVEKIEAATTKVEKEVEETKETILKEAKEISVEVPKETFNLGTKPEESKSEKMDQIKTVEEIEAPHDQAVDVADITVEGISMQQSVVQPMGLPDVDQHLTTEKEESHKKVEEPKETNPFLMKTPEMDVKIGDLNNGFDNAGINGQLKLGESTAAIETQLPDAPAKKLDLSAAMSESDEDASTSEEIAEASTTESSPRSVVEVGSHSADEGSDKPRENGQAPEPAPVACITDLMSQSMVEMGDSLTQSGMMTASVIGEAMLSESGMTGSMMTDPMDGSTVITHSMASSAMTDSLVGPDLMTGSMMTDSLTTSTMMTDSLIDPTMTDSMTASTVAETNGAATEKQNGKPINGIAHEYMDVDGPSLGNSR